METPTTLQEAVTYFNDFENCRQFMIAVRWSDGVVHCPTCGSEKVTYLQKARLYKCYGDHAKPKFSLKVGTAFEDSPIPLEKWLPVVWMLANCRNGVSSHEIGRAIGVTQKSAWFMLHRIRLAMQGAGIVKLGGPGSNVEVDETFIGGKARNMHASVRRRRDVKNPDSKTMVMGILERGGKVHAQVVPNRRKETILTTVIPALEKGTTVHTDELPAYIHAIGDEYEHRVINHLERYVDGNVHTNGIENFWSLLKRGLGGTYISVEPFHLFRYVDEQAFRFNNRKDEHGNKLTDAERFSLALSKIVGKRLTYSELTGKTQGRPI